MEIKKIKLKDERRGPESEQKWGILKYLSAEISYEKSEIIQDPMTRVSGVLGQKLGYDIVLLAKDCVLSCKLVVLHQSL